MKLNDKYIDPRRMQEFRDSRMVNPDQQAFANCPMKAINHEWPRDTSWESLGTDSGIDRG